MKTKLLFNRKNKLNNENKGLIEVEIYLSRTKRIVRTTGVYIEPKYWDNNNQRIKHNHIQASELNYKLLDLKNKIEREFLKNYSYVKRKEKKKYYFYEYFEFEIMQLQNENLSPGTQKIYNRTLKYLKEFCPKDFLFENLDVRFFIEFDLFLKNNKNLANNGRHSLFTKIKKVVNTAVLNDVIPVSLNPFKKGFKIKEIAPEKESLTLKELHIIEKLDLEEYPELILIRDMFLFSCYTGLRYGDLSQLSHDNFELLSDNKIRMKYIPQKTKHLYHKSISWIISDFWGGKANLIIKKYLSKTDSSFFNITNAFFNRELKKLQSLANIKTKIHSHLARHTCITLLVNDYQLDVTKAQLIAGHADIETTMRYLKTTENDLSLAAKKIVWD